MEQKRVFIKVEGIVQGVGFRPFVYNLAKSNQLNGWVNNNSEGVYIDIEGRHEKIKTFITTLKDAPPPLSRIEDIHIEYRELEHYSDFTIRVSERREERITLISPDMSICDDCIQDISDPNNSKYRYAFTNCTNCGPRFSIIQSIPYDRDKTTMKSFQMCESCLHEYHNPMDRRFHAQPNACSSCGPHLWVTDATGTPLMVEDPLLWTQDQLSKGKIFAIKGLTGFHLVCDALNETAVQKLRDRKKRPHKPFAVMAKDLEAVKQYCFLDAVEEAVLTGNRKPIVLLKQLAHDGVPKNIAPNQKTLGVMLPYTPIHHLLFNEELTLLVMTSANITGLPLEYENESALQHLSSIVDFFLLHNRDIYTPVDDSVVKVVKNEVRMLRRARGYAPEPLRIKNINGILALGPTMKNTFCISKGDFLFPSQHIGDLENLETVLHYERNIAHFQNIFDFKPTCVVSDNHPDYATTSFAEKLPYPQIKVQHHHAHIASCMLENAITDPVIGISFDGTGYGLDGTIWGGEFLVCDYESFMRSAHLSYISLPGGESAVREPWRMAVSYIYESLRHSLTVSEIEDSLCQLYGNKAIPVMKLIMKDVNCIPTSSMGRFFDAVSSLIGICHSITYEGQASMELEAVLESSETASYPYTIEKSIPTYIIHTDRIIRGILDDTKTGYDKGVMSAKFHNTIIHFSSEICSLLRKDTGINKVALSGGVFQNNFLLEKLSNVLETNHFQVYTHKMIPSNDGGISIGQMAIANKRLQTLK